MIIQLENKHSYDNIKFTELPNYIFPKGLTHDLLIIQFKENKTS